MSILSHGGLLVSDGSTPQAITAAPVKLTCFSANQAHSSTESGDQAIQPSYANDRIDVLPGVYLVTLSIAAETANATATWTVQVRKNSKPIHVGTDFKTTAGGNLQVHAALNGLIEVTDADLNSSGLCPLELYGQASGDNLTIRFAQLTVLRVDELAHGSILTAHATAAAQAIQDDARPLKLFSESGAHSSYESGDTAIQPDVSNDRIKVGVGAYLLFFNASGEVSNDVATYTFKARKNGSLLSVGCDREVTGSGEMPVGFNGILKIAAADLGSDLLCPIDVAASASFEESSSSSSSSNSSSSSSSSNSSSSSSSSSSSNSSSSSSSTNSSSSSPSSSTSSSSSSSSSDQTSSSSSSPSSSSSVNAGPTWTPRWGALTLLKVA